MRVDPQIVGREFDMITKMLMPKIGDMMETGLVAKWLKKEGDAVKRGEALLEITTDKATLEVEVFVEGSLLKIMVAEGQEVPVGATLALIGDPSDKIPEDLGQVAGPAPVEQQSAPQETPGQVAAPEPQKVEKVGESKSSPRARRTAGERGVDLSGVQGTGPGGRIVERDVLATPPASAAESKKATPLAKKISELDGVDLSKVTGTGIDGKITQEDVRSSSKVDSKLEALSPMRRVIAERMSASKREVPHFYLKITVDVGRLTAVREELNEIKGEQSKVSFNDFFVRATALALAQMPKVNSRWADGKVERVKSVHVGVAVSVDDGLMVPVVRDAQLKPVWQISQEVRELAAKARNKKLTPSEYSGGTFTVTNLGMFGIEEFLAIINPPESGILSIGTIQKVPAVVEDRIEVRPVCSLCLSADHRVIDGAEGARFLTLIKKLLEHPTALLIQD